MIVCYTDGGYDNSSRDNKSGYGSFRIYEYLENNIITDATIRNKFPEVTSSNEAEYQTLITLLEYLLVNYPSQEIFVYSDSKLMCNQLNSIWEIRSPKLTVFFQTAVVLLNKFSKWTLVWAPRSILVKELGH